MTDSAPCPNAFVPVVVGHAKPPSMADDRVVPANWTLPRQEVQWDHSRVDVVFHFWQCDKENHGWREGLPLTVAAQFRSEDRPSPSRQSQSRTKKEYCFPVPMASLSPEHWPVINAESLKCSRPEAP